MFLEALKCVLEDEGFKLPTQPAVSALKAAETLLRWASNGENSDTLGVFATELVTILKTCIRPSMPASQTGKDVVQVPSSKDF